MEWGRFVFASPARGVFLVLTHCLVSGLVSVRIRWIPHCTVCVVPRAYRDVDFKLRDCTFPGGGLLLFLGLFCFVFVLFFKGRREKGSAGEAKMWSLSTLMCS